jgi:hypothetical protein
VTPRDALLELYADARAEIPNGDFEPAGAAALEAAIAEVASALEEVVAYLAAEQEGGIPNPIIARGVLRDAIAGLMVAFAASHWTAAAPDVARA